MSRSARIVVVGPGLIGKQHIRLINENIRSSLVAIVAPNHEDNHSIAAMNGVKIYNALEDCINSLNVDGVIISSPNEFHAEQAKICIEAGIPVLIEKPITSSLDEAYLLVELVDRNNAKVLIGHHRAHSPIMAAATHTIKSGRLGQVVSIIGSAQFYKPAHYYKEGPWRKEKGGGPILINLIHEIGNFRALCGEIVAVQAVASSYVRKFVVEDTVAMNFIFENGALGTFMLSDTAATARSWEQTSGENPSYPMYADEDCYIVAGTHGSLSIPTMRLKYYPADVDRSWWNGFSEEVVPVVRADPLTCQLENFLSVIRGEDVPVVSALDGLRNLLVTEAIKEAALSRKLIELRY